MATGRKLFVYVAVSSLVELTPPHPFSLQLKKMNNCVQRAVLRRSSHAGDSTFSCVPPPQRLVCVLLFMCRWRQMWRSYWGSTRWTPFCAWRGDGRAAAAAPKVRDWSFGLTSQSSSDNHFLPAASVQLHGVFSLFWNEEVFGFFTSYRQIYALKAVSVSSFAPSSLVDLYKNTDLMWKQSVWTSTISSHLAALHLKEGGLLTLAGAKAALSGTGGEPLVGGCVCVCRHRDDPKGPRVTPGSAGGSVIRWRVYCADVFVGWPPKSNNTGNRKRRGAAAEEGKKKLTHLSDTRGSRAASLGGGEGRRGVDKMDPGEQKGEWRQNGWWGLEERRALEVAACHEQDGDLIPATAPLVYWRVRRSVAVGEEMTSRRPAY